MIALALIVKGSDSEAAYLERCLSHTAHYFDGIFISISHKEGEEPNQKVVDVCQKFNANVSHFVWENDFSKARNFNFSQVPSEYDYIMWCDADDAFRGLENLEKVIKENPNVDVFSVNYLYSFDEQKNPIVVHMKTQIVKNDGCVEWAGALHEDFKENRSLTRHFIKGIERIHLTDNERIESNKYRNLEVAEQQARDFPEDPRSFWNLGNSLKAAGKNAEAITVFDKFLKTSNSDDEKYIVRLRRAESMWGLGRKAEAIDEARYAIGLRPNYPDAYHLCGSLLFESGRFHEAIKMYLEGIQKKPPYYSILVYNPRDYDYAPMMNLAKCFLNISRPDLALPMLEQCLKIYPKDENIKRFITLMKGEEKLFLKAIKAVQKLEKITDKKKLKKELDKLPIDLQSYPAICQIRNTNFVKQESSGKDIVIFCSQTHEEWTPETAITKGIGGSEEAVIWLSKLLAKRGYNVTVYNSCGHKELNFEGVTYKPFWAWNYRDKQDITILWRTPRYAEYDINSTKVFLDMHDALPEGELNEKRLAKIDKIFVKSHFHRSLYPNVPDEKFAIIPNGIDPEIFPEEDPSSHKDPYLLINTSSPDRSVSALVDCFIELKKRVPQARLQWAYGWKVFDSAYASNQKMMEWKTQLVEKMDRAGVEQLGRLGHGEIAELYKKARIFAYPSEFAEIDCISLTKAMAAGAIPVTTDFAAMGEKKGHGGSFIHSEKTKDTWAKDYQHDFSLENHDKKMEWVDEAVKYLTEEFAFTWVAQLVMSRWAKENYSWENVASSWEKYF